jgi:signal transduction histidine kinase
MLSHLMESGAASETVRKQSHQIQRSAREMGGMISELLEYTRTQLGKGIPIKPKACSMAVICRDAVEEVRSARPERQLLLSVPEGLAGLVDQARLRQALSNLLNNAVQHGDPASPVSLTVRTEGQTMAIEVKNMGDPIPPASLQVIFDPLVQLSARSAAKPDVPSTSLGLGLFIAREIALGHHGTLDVTSDAENGTVFTMRLPMQSA